MIFTGYIKIFLLGIILAFILTRLALWLFPKINLLDFPERYGLTRARLPYPGGIVFVFLALGIIFIDQQFEVLLLPILILAGLSFWDDIKHIPVLPRLVVHFLLGAYLFYQGIRIDFIGNPFQETNFELADLPFISFFVTILWILILQNAMNFFDGIRGLTVGVSGVGFLALGILGLVRPELFLDPSHAPLTTANFFLGGLCVGGFWYFWKGKILLGDTGSQILGFLLAVMSIFSGAKIATTILVLGLPILDVFFVALRRLIIERRSPFKGDLKHLHHNLVRRIGESATTLLLVFLSAVLGTVAVMFAGFNKLIALLVVFVLIFLLQVWAIKKSK